MRLSTKPKILWIGQSSAAADPVIEQLRQHHEVVPIESSFRAPALAPDIVGVYVGAQLLQEGVWLGRLLQNERILEGMPDGVALLDSVNTVLWANDCLKSWLNRRDLVGSNFYQSFGCLQYKPAHRV